MNGGKMVDERGMMTRKKRFAVPACLVLSGLLLTSAARGDLVTTATETIRCTIISIDSPYVWLRLPGGGRRALYLTDVVKMSVDDPSRRDSLSKFAPARFVPDSSGQFDLVPSQLESLNSAWLAQLGLPPERKRPTRFLALGLGLLGGGGTVSRAGVPGVGGWSAAWFPSAELHHDKLLLSGSAFFNGVAGSVGSATLNELSLDAGVGIFTKTWARPPFYSAGWVFAGVRYAAARFSSPNSAQGNHDMIDLVVGVRAVSNEGLKHRLSHPGVTMDGNVALGYRMIPNVVALLIEYATLHLVQIMLPDQPAFMDVAFYFGGRPDRTLSIKAGPLIRGYLVPTGRDSQGARGGISAGLAVIVTYAPQQ
jgi:hypothetical protein